MNEVAGSNAPSLLRRVFLRMSITMFCAIVLVVGVLYAGFVEHVDSLRDRSLTGQASDIARHLVADGRGGLRVELPAGLAAAYAKTGAYRFVVLDQAGHVVAASHGVRDALDPDPATPTDGPRQFTTLDAATGGSFFGASSRHDSALGPVTVQVQQSAAHEDVILDTFLDELGGEVAWIVFAVFAAILLVTWLTLRASLSPLQSVSRQAGEIGPETLDRRLSLDDVPAEVRPIVVAVNQALDRVEDAFMQQRRFTADAAHEMRTPIAIVRAHLDALDPQDARALGEDLSTLDRMVGQLLRLAQVDSMTVDPRGTADLHRVALNVAELMGPAAIAAGRSIAVGGDDRVEVRGDAEAIEMAVRNLVENGLNHTAPGTEVEIRLSRASHSISVGDQGPGIPPQLRAHVLERFWRGDRRDGTGAGLGLSIVARVAQAHGAALDIEAGEQGGALLRLRFPAETGVT